MKKIVKLAIALLFFISLSADAQNAEETGREMMESGVSDEEVCENIRNRAEGIMQLRQNGVHKEDMLAQVGHNEAFRQMVEHAYKFNRYPNDSGMRRLNVERFANSMQEICLKEMALLRKRGK